MKKNRYDYFFLIPFACGSHELCDHLVNLIACKEGREAAGS